MVRGMAQLSYLSVCSGIEAATQAWHPLGWVPVAFSEIDPFPCEVLHHRLGAGRPMFMPEPDRATSDKERRERAAAIRNVSRIPETDRVPNFGDMTQFERWPDADVDVLVGGTPCQDYSVAGQRLGMAGSRGQLTLTYVEIAARYRPRWIVWENVPGVLSSNAGRDFARFLGEISGQSVAVPEGGWKNSGIIPGIADAYGVAFRVLDAQYVRTRRRRGAVPQRRRRVFVVGYLGDWRRAAAVLFDRESLRGDPPPRREAGQRPARGFECGPSGGSFTDVAPTLDTGCKDGPIRNQIGAGVVSLAHGQGGSEIGIGYGPTLTCNHEAPIVVSPTMRAMGHGDSHANAGGQLAVAFAENSRAELRLCGGDGQVMSQLTTGGGKPGQGQPAIAMPWAVRRLTPRECERLQGFPDDFTAIPRGNKPVADGPRYKALGNSMAVNVMEWIGRRIDLVDAL